MKHRALSHSNECYATHRSDRVFTLEVEVMDLSSPISSVIPSAQGAVLAVLARTDEPLSGRAVGITELIGLDRSMTSTSNVKTLSLL